MTVQQKIHEYFDKMKGEYLRMIERDLNEIRETIKTGNINRQEYLETCLNHFLKDAGCSDELIHKTLSQARLKCISTPKKAQN